MDSMKMNGNSENNFLTAREISRFLRIPLNTIYRLTKKGVVKGIKIGKQWRYNKYEFEKYLKNGIDSRNIHLEKYKERRAYPRMNCNFKCESRVNIMGRKEFCLAGGYITNISCNGIFLSNNRCTDKINIGDPVDLNFNLVSDIDSQTHNINAKGRIVRKNYNGVGVKFRHIDEKYKDLINEFVD